MLWHASTADEEKVYLDVLTKAFSDLGYVEGENIEFLHRFPAEQPKRFRALARELADTRPISSRSARSKTNEAAAEALGISL